MKYLMLFIAYFAVIALCAPKMVLAGVIVSSVVLSVPAWVAVWWLGRGVSRNGLQ